MNDELYDKIEAAKNSAAKAIVEALIQTLVQNGIAVRPETVAKLERAINIRLSV